MKSFIPVLLFSLSSHSLLADSHSSILIANAQMQAVSNYALEDASDLYRVMSVTRIKGCISSGVFIVSLGGMNSKTGKESVEFKNFVVAHNAIEADGAISTDPSKIKITFAKTCSN